MRLLFLLLVSLCAVQSFAQNVGYGFVNRKGNQILTLNPEQGVLKGEDALGFRRAICDGGRIFEIFYVDKQVPGPRDTMRAVAANFDQHEGYVFRIDRGRAEPDGNCLMATPSFLEQKEPLPLTAARSKSGPPPECDAATVKALPAVAERTPRSCAVIAQAGHDVQLLAIEYQPIGSSLLGAVALRSGDTLALHKFPAEQGDSAWRVDDGGKWDPASLQPLFVLRRSNGDFDVGLVWAGHEGATLHLLRTSATEMSDRVLGYRYWLPK